eukprot:1191183-Prorocentrum_minimum.AAC.1
MGDRANEKPVTQPSHLGHDQAQEKGLVWGRFEGDISEVGLIRTREGGLVWGRFEGDVPEVGHIRTREGERVSFGRGAAQLGAHHHHGNHVGLLDLRVLRGDDVAVADRGRPRSSPAAVRTPNGRSGRA